MNSHFTHILFCLKTFHAVLVRTASKLEQLHLLEMSFYIKNAIFWDVMPCGSCKNQHFRGTYRLHHQGDKNQ
jgi:hypothetical protein